MNIFANNDANGKRAMTASAWLCRIFGGKDNVFEPG